MLKIRNVSKAFGDTDVLVDVHFEVKRSSIFGIAGPSGSGKSTLLRCIQKLERIDRGSIECGGKTAFMFQDFQLFPHMTVLRNLIYAPSLNGKSRVNDYKKQAENILKTLGIASKIDAYPGTLSGGQKQRVALARSLMSHPDVLLCDEPTSGLDVSTRLDVVSLLKSVNERFNITMIIASHDLDFLTSISDRIVLLKNGEIIVDINPQVEAAPIDLLKAYY
jgi:polar amino acid transport system ATP-binding protein